MDSSAVIGLPIPIVTATIIPGVTTNRVRVRRGARPRKPSHVKLSPAELAASLASRPGRPPRMKPTGPGKPVKYGRDASVAGKPYKQVVFVAPVAELAELDAWCARAQMSRSHFIRQAAKHFIAFVSRGRA